MCDVLLCDGLAQQGEAMAMQGSAMRRLSNVEHSGVTKGYGIDSNARQRQGATKPSGGAAQQCQAEARERGALRRQSRAKLGSVRAKRGMATAPQSCAERRNRRARQGKGTD